MRVLRGSLSIRTGLVRLVSLAMLWVSVGCATPQAPDPWEPMNRGVFAFNEVADKYALEPVAKAWDFILPGFVQTGLANFFINLNMPVVMANDLLQAKPMAAFEDLTRLVHNTVFGLGGLIDVASMVDIPSNDEDFGQTLGVWGVPPGPYLMMPLLGPYTLRDGFGEIVDTTASSYAYFTPFWFDVANLSGVETLGVSVGTYSLQLLNLRAIYLEELEASRKDAFDYYVFVRNAYLQNRRAKVLDQSDAPALVDEDELYFYDEEESEENGQGEDFEDDEEDYDDV